MNTIASPWTQVDDAVNTGMITNVMNVYISGKMMNVPHKSVERLIARQLEDIAFLEKTFTTLGHDNICATVKWTKVPEVPWISPTIFYTATHLGDRALADHTKLVLLDICNTIKEEHPEFGDQWCVKYLITTYPSYLIK
jgi:hypothetical protein